MIVSLDDRAFYKPQTGFYLSLEYLGTSRLKSLPLSVRTQIPMSFVMARLLNPRPKAEVRGVTVFERSGTAYAY